MRIRQSLVVVAAATGLAQPVLSQGWAGKERQVVLEAHALVAEHFYDTAKLEAVGWEAIAIPPDEFNPELSDQLLYWVYSNVGFAVNRDISRALDKLGASHTEHYHEGQREYYDLLDVFRNAPALGDDLKALFPPDGRVECGSIGMAWDWFGRDQHVTEVFPGSIAERAGVRSGDGLVVHAGNHGEFPLQMQLNGIPVEGSVEIDLYRKEFDWSDHEGLCVEPVSVNPTEEYLELMTNSARVVEREGAELAYIRIYSWAGQHYQDKLEELLQREPLASADGIVLDIRGGWGGADPRYLDLFGAPMPTITQVPRDGEAFTWDPSAELPERTFYWRKPVVLLVDEGTRSGKEIIAWAFKKHGIGPVVGARTAGAVLAGRPFVLSDGSLLYLAVADVLVDGERLEGVGVEPDIAVARDLPFSDGADPQLEAALGALVGEIRGGDSDAP